MRVFLSILAMVFIFNGVSYSQTSSVRTAFDEATVHAREGRFGEALEKYRDVIVPQGDDQFAAKVHFNIGVCLYRLGQPESAITEYEKAIKLNAKYQRAFYGLGMANAALRKTKEARAAFYQAVKLDKTDGEAWFDLGMILLAERGEKDYDSAREAFENAARYHSTGTADAINNIGVILVLNGELEMAEEKFETALALSKQRSIEAANNLKVCARYKQTRYKQSLNRELIAGLTFSGEQKN
jgi:Flp pilus assembly protein TadD